MRTPKQMTAQLLDSLSARVLHHAAQRMDRDEWLIVLAFFDQDEIIDVLRRTKCRDLGEAIRLFEELGLAVVERLRAEAADEERMAA